MRHFKAELFKTLSHPTRIRLLDALRNGPQPVLILAETLGLEQPVISQHLAALRSRGLVQTRREGSSIWYSVTDPAIWKILDIARDIHDRHLKENRAQFEAEAHA